MDFIKAHWGKGLLGLAVIFFVFTFTDSGKYSSTYEDKKSSLSNITKEVNTFYSANLNENKTDPLGINPKLQAYLEKEGMVDWLFEVDTFHNKEDWDLTDRRSKEKVPYQTMVGTPLTFKIPVHSKLLSLQNLQSPDIEIKIDQNFTGLTKKVTSPNSIEIKFNESTPNGNITMRIHNKRNGDIATFNLSAKSQTELYYSLSEDSIKVHYNPEILDKVKITWEDSLVSTGNSAIAEVVKYTLQRQEFGPDQELSAEVPFITLKTWDKRSNLDEWAEHRSYEDTLKANHKYRYRVLVDIFRVSRSIDPDKETELMEVVLSGPKHVLDTSKSDLAYKPSEVVVVGKDKLLLGFLRATDLGTVDQPRTQVEIAMKRWINGQWVAGVVAYDLSQKTLEFGTSPKHFPDNKKVFDEQVTQGVFVPIKGMDPKVKLGTSNRAHKVDFEYEDYFIYKVGKHGKGDSLSSYLKKNNFYDEESAALFFDEEGDIKADITCHSFWIISKKDPFFTERAPKPTTVKIFFGNTSQTFRALQEKKKAINAVAKPEGLGEEPADK